MVLASRSECSGRGPRKRWGAFPWGFGVHAPCTLEFTLPACARAFRTRLGLDHAAGDGGCARGSVILDVGKRTTLSTSTLLAGPSGVVSTGSLPLAVSEGSSRLILDADSVADDHPAGTDPLGIRDLVNWIEPLLELDPNQVQVEVLRRARKRCRPGKDGP